VAIAALGAVLGAIAIVSFPLKAHGPEISYCV
jgi:hypothetical protein